MSIADQLAEGVGGKVAKHFTSAGGAAAIRRSGFKASDRGWYGSGLYAYIDDRSASGAEGKGTEAVKFRYDHLKTTDGGKPPEFSPKQWDRARRDDDYYRKLLKKHGYQARINRSAGWIIVMSWAVKHVRPEK